MLNKLCGFLWEVTSTTVKTTGILDSYSEVRLPLPRESTILTFGVTTPGMVAKDVHMLLRNLLSIEKE